MGRDISPPNRPGSVLVKQDLVEPPVLHRYFANVSTFHLLEHGLEGGYTELACNAQGPHRILPPAKAMLGGILASICSSKTASGPGEVGVWERLRGEMGL